MSKAGIAAQPKRSRKRKRKYVTDEPKASVVDVFCGVGGLSYGFVKKGFRIAGGIDIDEACRYPFETNNQSAFVKQDVATLTAKQVKDLFVPGRRRILVGCAPCQPFSSYNQKNDDPKWRLLGKFGDLVADVRPDILSMENVPNLLTFKGGKTFKQFVAKLAREEYEVVWDVLFGPDYGLAQNRSRLVLLASKLGVIGIPKPTHKGRHRTVRQVIGKLASIQQGESDDKDLLHRASKLSALNRKRIAAAIPGGTWHDWDEKLVADCHKDESGRGYAAVYGRMEWDAPSPTITTQFYGFGNGRFGHPEQDRGISLREGALLQGFPKSYEFVAPGEPIRFKSLGRLIGNAVPVNLSAAIASTVRSHLEEHAR